ncbi:hypothetical protein KVR01_004634 [Diaporthe batatas]|uniref:uncharacterized protein n=1 Tax=Diaporthe batatas TaxID=748121 RepID=UPI001D03FFAE|nr:uncharacterized protein KVR01_004634 [Diaporthe batatas]KAG8166082.1 hypothetical protein KVR01_004634 [Diaporthe batatas]
MLPSACETHVGLATKDTLSLLRAWKAEGTPASPRRAGRVVSKPTKIVTTNQTPQAADGWGAGSEADPVPRGTLSWTHRPHSACSFSTVISTRYMKSIHKRPQTARQHSVWGTL